MNVAAIKHVDIANGPGCRTSLFVSGCRRGCPGCFNPEAQDFGFGQPYTPELEDALVESLRAPWVAGITLLGGEPMEPENQPALLGLLRRVRAELPGKDVWCYTGFTFEELQPGGAGHVLATDELLSLVDVLVDGPFVAVERDLMLRFRGSANQRLLDVPASRAAGAPVPWQDEAVYASHALSAARRP